MQSTNEVHVDLVRLLAAAERLLLTGEPSAEDGRWEHWPRFCQFLNTLAGLQASCQARLLEPRSHPNTPSVSSSPSTMPILPTPEDLAGLDRRIEILRRKRDDLVADKIAAAHAAAIEKAAAAAAAESTTVDSASNESRAYDDGIQGEVQEERSPRTRSSPSKRTGLSRRSNPSGGYDNPAGDELWRGRREEAAGRRGDEQEADTAQAEEVTQEIASMAGRLKESSMAINTTLRTQTRILEDTGDAAAQNVDNVKRENARVAERLRKKRAAMFASWCMMLTVVATFFATYALVILPFEKRRGPFVTGGVFAHAADTTPILDMQQQQQQLQDDVAAAAASSRSGLAALDLEAQRKVMDERKRQANEAYVERARLELEMLESQNAGLRLVAEEKERYRQRQAKDMMINARERKAKKKAEVEAAQARVDEQEQAHEDALEARNIAHSPTNTEKDVPATGKTEAKTEVEADTTSERSEVQEEDEQPERQQTAEEHRRRAQEAYEARSRQVADQEEVRNAGLRLVAEEKERYRDRQAKKMMNAAAERKSARQAQKQADTDEALKEDALQAGASDTGSSPQKVEPEAQKVEPEAQRGEAESQQRHGTHEDGSGDGGERVRDEL